MVVTSGVTFAVQAVEIGANQVPIPIGDATFVTCGPFECAAGMGAPDISIANSSACNAWDPTVDIQVGRIDNDVIADDTDDTGNDGVDLGIVTSSNLAMDRGALLVRRFERAEHLGDHRRGEGHQPDTRHDRR